MKQAVANVEERLNVFAGQVYAACRMGGWCFGDEEKLFFSTSPHQEEYHMLLQTGGCLELAVARREEEGAPFILNGLMGLEWIAEWAHLQDGGRFLLFFGPFFLKNFTVEMSLEKLGRAGVSERMRRQYLNVLGDVPVLEWNMLCQYAAMLHYLMYEESVNLDDLRMETPETEKDPKQDETLEEDLLQKAGAADFSRMVALENWLLSRLGKPQLMDDLGTAGFGSYRGELLDFHLNDLIRQVKDNYIIFNGLCARRSMTLGVPVATAKELESDWVYRIEALRSAADARELFQNLYSSYSDQVRLHGENMGMSKAVRECRDYVQMNYMKEIDLEQLARHCGYTEYYLTRKFAKETGMKLNDYIRSVRIDAAKVLLLTSKKDIQQISSELRFGNRSYFDRVFTKQVGTSPAKFREQMGRIPAAKQEGTGEA